MFGHHRSPANAAEDRDNHLAQSDRAPAPDAGILPANSSPVQRSSRLVLLMQLADIRSETVLGALRSRIQTLPVQLWRSLTWDQGAEMAAHARFTVDTGVQVYFCDPKSPWQRGTNENTNGLLREYFPKRTSLRGYSQDDLDAVAAQLNRRPRKTLQYMTPSEKFAEAVAATR